MKKILPSFNVNKKISYKLLVLTLLFSALITLLITALQLYIDYKHGINSINKQFDLVVESHSNSIVQGIWVYDDSQINLQLKGIVSLPDILFTSIDLNNGRHYEYGKRKNEDTIEKTFKLIYHNKIKDVYLGELNVIADLNALYAELKNKVLILLLSQAIKTFFVSLFILYLFQILITRHIKKILSYTSALTFDKRNEPLTLNKIIFKDQHDELDSLADAINNMQTKIYNAYVETKNQEKLLQEQSRLAQMGEMISMIAHQWRQPLTVISLKSSKLRLVSELKKFDLTNQEDAKRYETYVNNNIMGIDDLVQTLTTTIDDFRDFYKPNKKLVTVPLENIISKSLNIIMETLSSEGIKVVQEYDTKEDVQLYENEMKQVILNLLKNAQDNFKEKNIKDPYIKITIKDSTLSVCDNGGGIADDVIEKIFDPYFSTKSEMNGTGLGLYMSKIIVEEHHNGKLSVKNKNDGVCFIIELGII